MDRITRLPDDMLLKILYFLPTKVAVSTCILSKRWEFLWMWLPKLDYYTLYTDTDFMSGYTDTDFMSESEKPPSDTEKLRCFLNRTMPLHRAPVIESFRLDMIHRLSKPEDVKQWVLVAVSRQLRELDISYNPYVPEEVLLPSVLLPSSLYACKSLEILKLSGEIALNVPPTASLPSLKVLQLKKVTGVNGESLTRLLSICPVLEKLSGFFCGDNISVISPSLLSLSVRFQNTPQELEIDTPCLKYLKLDTGYITIVSIWNMPKLEEAYLNVGVNDINFLFGSITSVKRLTLCCSQVCSDNLVFNQLEHLKLCNCRVVSRDVDRAWFLKDSPNLRVLERFQMEYHR